MASVPAEYPREWFAVSRFADEPRAKLFSRETASTLFYGLRGEERRVPKSSAYETWYPTREEAQAVIDARRAWEARAKDDKRVRDAAHDLLALVHQYRNDMLYPVAPDSKERRIAAIDAVLAKISA